MELRAPRRGTRRVDLHFYEALEEGTLRYGSIHEPFDFAEADLEARGSIAGTGVTCESPQFALRCRTGYQPRAVDRHDVARLCARFGLRPPDRYRG
jgi:lincosamide nucleotidyltransferase A/C/D/E